MPEYSAKNKPARKSPAKLMLERIWFLCAVSTVVFSVIGQMRLDPQRWTMGVFVLSFFGLFFVGVAWVFVDHFEYIDTLKKRVAELEKQKKEYSTENKSG